MFRLKIFACSWMNRDGSSSKQMKTDWFDSAELRRGSMLTVSWWIYLRGYEIIYCATNEDESTSISVDLLAIVMLCGIGQWFPTLHWERWCTRYIRPTTKRSWIWFWLKSLHSIGSYPVRDPVIIIFWTGSVHSNVNVNCGGDGQRGHMGASTIIVPILFSNRSDATHLHSTVIFDFHRSNSSHCAKQRQWQYWQQSPTKRRI